ncbi:hypothetical protein Ssi03_59190 [Sphaerisporangium siamense]|nr:hypothetical protein Ssi03_59190 [Sphaerisporangium siamense]
MLAVLLLVAGFVVLAPGTACACSCSDLKPADQMRLSAAVFTGTVVAARQVEGDPAGPTPPIVYTFRPDQVYKGEPVTEVRVASNAESPACGYRFSTGGRYLVFASAEKTGMLQPDPGVPLHTGLCMGNRQVALGTGPVRAGDPVLNGDPISAELVDALGAPKPPSAAPSAPATAPPTAAPASPAASTGGSAPTWIIVAGAVAGAAVVVAAWRLPARRRVRRD